MNVGIGGCVRIRNQIAPKYTITLPDMQSALRRSINKCK